MFTIKHAALIVVASITLVGYNLFLIQRDAKLFDAYTTQVTSK